MMEIMCMRFVGCVMFGRTPELSNRLPRRKETAMSEKPRLLQRLVRLRDIGTWWLVGTCVAIVLHALGIVGVETVAGALWFPGWLFICLVLTSKPNKELSHAAKEVGNG
jgi:hypothetical protein